MKTALYNNWVALFLLLYCYMGLNTSLGLASTNKNSKNAIAKVIKVTPSIDNKWIVAIKDPKSPSGYSVNIKKSMDNFFFGNYFLAFMYARSSPKDKLEDFFSSRICDLVNPEVPHYSHDKFMPRQIIDYILPGQYGKCNTTASTKPIKASGMVNTDPKMNLDVKFPKSSPFELVVNILSQGQISDPKTKYFFQVTFSVGGNF